MVLMVPGSTGFEKMILTRSHPSARVVLQCNDFLVVADKGPNSRIPEIFRIPLRLFLSSAK